MKLLVTGSAGFLGRAVVAEALRRGHVVRAMVRPACDISALAWSENEPEAVRVDLRCREGLVDAVGGVDAVIHLAATKFGDLYSQLNGTVLATENLLAAMAEARVRRIVLVSSFSVYDYRPLWTFGLLNEDSPLEAGPTGRDPYSCTKLLQEKLVRACTASQDLRSTILRPGVIFGPGETWTARLGIKLGNRTWVRTGAWARLPLTYVANCADAVLLCVESNASVGRTFNVVDDETPTQRRYARAIRLRTIPPPRVIPVPWTALRVVASVASVSNRIFFGSRARLPQVLDPSCLHARCKPLRYTNASIEKAVGWRPRVSLKEALDRCFSRTRPATGEEAE